MKFTTSILALALAAAGVSAAPNSQLLERQAGTVLVEFYNTRDCTGPLSDDTVPFDDGSSRVCTVNTITNPYQSFKVVRNEAGRTLNFYSRSDCTTRVPPSPAGNVIPVASGNTGCFVQQVGSYQFGATNTN